MARQGEKPSAKTSGHTAPRQTTDTEAFQTKTAPATGPCIGLGVSAGGLQAFSDFFAALPGKRGTAFVANHPAGQDHNSIAADPVAQHTRMKVAPAQDNTPNAADHVCIIRPKGFVSLKNGIVRVTYPTEETAAQVPVDCVFLSPAVTVVLSDAGADDTVGIRGVTDGGGMVSVPNPEEATYGRLPLSAVATRASDPVLPAPNANSHYGTYNTSFSHTWDASQQPTTTAGIGGTPHDV